MRKIKTLIHRALKTSEKYLKTDMIYIAKGGSWLLLGQGTMAVSGILLAIGFANFLPKEVYGNYKFVLSLGGIIGVLTLTGMKTAVFQAVARGYEGELRKGFRTQLKWSSFIVLATLIVSLYYYMNENSTVAISLLAIGLLTPLIEGATLYRSFLNGKKDFRRETIFSTVQNILPLTALLGLIFFTQNLILIVAVSFISQTLMALVMYAKTLKIYKPSNATDNTTKKFAKHLSVINIFSTTAAHLDKIIIFHFLGATELAIYAFATMIPSQLNGLLKKLSQLAFPKFSEKSKQEIKANLLPKTVKLTCLSTFLAVGYISIAPFFFNTFFPQYTEAIFYSQVFVLNIILTGSITLVATFFQSHKLVKANHVSTIFHNTTRIVLILLLVVPYGIFGVISAILIARTATILLSYTLVKYDA